MLPSALKNKRDLTKLQILVEIASRQPNVRQKEVADRVGVTPQAVSEYVKELQSEGYVRTDGRVRYNVTKQGVEWIIQTARELKRYSRFILEDIISHVAVGSAIAEERFEEGQKVHLQMRGGLLYASTRGDGASAVTLHAAEIGEDIAVGSLEGIIDLETSMVTVCRVPGVKRGGSRNVRLDELRRILVESKGYLIGAVGVEARVSIEKAGGRPDMFFGSREAAVEAAFHGLPSVIVSVDEEVPLLLERLESEGINYRLFNLVVEE